MATRRTGTQAGKARPANRKSKSKARSKPKRRTKAARGVARSKPAGGATQASASSARKPAPPGKRTRRLVEIEGLDIELRVYRELGFKPETVLVGISSEGVVGPLVASQVIQQLDMDQVCALESPMFPPTAMVYFEKPKLPARIYASKKHRLAVVLAEFAPIDDLARPLAYAILSWCQANGARRVIGVDSFPAHASTPDGVPVAAIGATPRDRKDLAKARVSVVRHGAVTGVAGVLLNEGRWLDLPTIVLMASLGPTTEADTALHVLDLLHRLMPGVPVRPRETSREPTQLERAIKAAHQRSPNLDFI